jgi:phenylacetate-CoA oxygenase PaaJ subunit
MVSRAGAEEALFEVLRGIPDPEVPALDIVELGIVRRVELRPNGAVTVDVTPTYSGCPAMQMIEQEIVAALRANGYDRVELRTVYSPAWTTDWLSDAAKAKIGALLGDDPERDAIVDRVASAVGLSGGSFPVAELFWGARKLLESQAARRPLLLVIDDIHSAEPTFLEFLEHLVDTIRDRSILILCSARPELLEEHADWTNQARVEQIDLQPLGSADVESMIDRLLGGADLSVETRDRVVAAAEGNPLYIEQIVSMVKERGDVEFVVPPTIHALLAARLDALTREERAVVEPASVIGLVFAEPAVEAMVPDGLRLAVPDHLSHLDRKQFVHPAAGEEDPLFRFHHILVRDAAYQSLLKRARANLHEQFVAWAEPVNRDRGRETEFEEILGYHLEQAVRYRSELGPLDAGGRELAVRAAVKLGSAGRRAFARSDLPAAGNLLQRAIALLPADDVVRLELLYDLGFVHFDDGEFAESLSAFHELEATAAQIENESLRRRARAHGSAVVVRQASRRRRWEAGHCKTV